MGSIEIDNRSIIKNISIDDVLIGKSNWYKENTNEELKKVVFPVA